MSSPNVWCRNARIRNRYDVSAAINLDMSVETANTKTRTAGNVLSSMRPKTAVRHDRSTYASIASVLTRAMIGIAQSSGRNVSRWTNAAQRMGWHSTQPRNNGRGSHWTTQLQPERSLRHLLRPHPPPKPYPNRTHDKPNSPTPITHCWDHPETLTLDPLIAVPNEQYTTIHPPTHLATKSQQITNGTTTPSQLRLPTGLGHPTSTRTMVWQHGNTGITCMESAIPGHLLRKQNKTPTLYHPRKH